MSSEATDTQNVTIVEYRNGKLVAEEVCEGLGVIRMDRDDGLGVEHVEKLTEALHVAMAAGV